MFRSLGCRGLSEILVAWQLQEGQAKVINRTLNRHWPVRSRLSHQHVPGLLGFAAVLESTLEKLDLRKVSGEGWEGGPGAAGEGKEGDLGGSGQLLY